MHLVPLPTLNPTNVLRLIQVLLSANSLFQSKSIATFPCVRSIQSARNSTGKQHSSEHQFDIIDELVFLDTDGTVPVLYFAVHRRGKWRNQSEILHWEQRWSHEHNDFTLKWEVTAIDSATYCIRIFIRLEFHCSLFVTELQLMFLNWLWIERVTEP